MRLTQSIKKLFMPAFTLAEILTVLSLLGILAVTMVSLNHIPYVKYTVAQGKLTQVSASLQGWGRKITHMNESGIGALTEIRTQEDIVYSIFQYFNNIKKEESYENETIDISGDNHLKNFHKITLTNGTILGIKWLPDGGNDFPVNEHILAIITITVPIDNNLGNLTEEYMLTLTKLVELGVLCPENTYAKGRKCLPCEGGQISEQNSLSCHCPEERPLWIDGICEQYPECDEFYDMYYICTTCYEQYGNKKPIWNGYDCISCEEYDDGANPIWDSLEGICTNCTHYHSAKTYWTGDECTCPNDKQYYYDDACNVCPEATPVNDSGHCCPTDKPYWEDGKCVVHPACPADKPYWYDKKCQKCPEERPVFFAANSICCPNKQHPNENNICVLDEPTPKGHCAQNYIPIYTADELARIGNDAKYPLTQNYCLMKNIDMSKTVYANNWTPIAINVPNGGFRGIFDGNENEIQNMKITSSAMYVGLFAYAMGTVKNLGVTGLYINSDYTAGGIVGAHASTGRIENCYTTGIIKGGRHIGGLIGHFYGDEISNSYSTAIISDDKHTSSGSGVGGLVGYVSNGWVKNCYAAGNVTGYYGHTGGLIGKTDSQIGQNSNKVSSCFATGNVSTGQTAGGLIGRSHGTIENSYATGKVSGVSDTNLGMIGGLVGYANAIVNSYSVGEVVPSTARYAGGFAGLLADRGACSFNYYNITTSKMSASVGNGDSIGVAGLSNEAFKGSASAWSNDIWCFFANGYPRLKNMPKGAPSCNSL